MHDELRLALPDRLLALRIQARSSDSVVQRIPIPRWPTGQKRGQGVSGFGVAGPHHIGSCDRGDKTEWQGFVVKRPPPRGDTGTIGLLVREKRRSDNHGRGRGV